jgi:hypothetical protein
MLPPGGAVDGDVVDRDAAFGQQLLDIAVGQAVAEVPADREGDHFGWEPEPGERRPADVVTGGSRSTHPPSFLSWSLTAVARARGTQQTPTVSHFDVASAG